MVHDELVGGEQITMTYELRLSTTRSSPREMLSTRPNAALSFLIRNAPFEHHQRGRVPSE